MLVCGTLQDNPLLPKDGVYLAHVTKLKHSTKKVASSMRRLLHSPQTLMWYPQPDHRGLTYCQRQFGLTGTTRDCHATSHRAGRTSHRLNGTFEFDCLLYASLLPTQFAQLMKLTVISYWRSNPLFQYNDFGARTVSRTYLATPSH